MFLCYFLKMVLNKMVISEIHVQAHGVTYYALVSVGKDLKSFICVKQWCVHTHRESQNKKEFHVIGKGWTLT